MNDICFYFLSDLLQLFRYLRHLLVLSKKLNCDILKSKSAKSSTQVILLKVLYSVLNNVTGIVLLADFDL